MFEGTAGTVIWEYRGEATAKTQMLVPLVAANTFPDCSVVHVTWKEFWMSLWQNKLVNEIMGEGFFFLDDQLLSCLVIINTQQPQVMEELIIANNAGSQAFFSMGQWSARATL